MNHLPPHPPCRFPHLDTHSNPQNSRDPEVLENNIHMTFPPRWSHNSDSGNETCQGAAGFLFLLCTVGARVRSDDRGGDGIPWEAVVLLHPCLRGADALLQPAADLREPAAGVDLQQAAQCGRHQEVCPAPDERAGRAERDGAAGPDGPDKGQHCAPQQVGGGCCFHWWWW